VNRAPVRIALSILLAASIVPAVGRPTTLTQRIEAQRKKTQAIHRQLHDTRAKLQAATVRVGDLQAQLNQTSAAISRVNGDLDVLAAQQASTKRKIAWNTLQLNAAEKSLHLHDDLLKRRLVDVYERGDLGYLSVLLQSKSFADFVERWEDLRLLIVANQRAVKDRKTAEQKVASVQTNLEATQAALQSQQQAQQRARNQLAALAEERRNLVAVADAQRRQVASQEVELENLSASEEAQLEQMIVERQRELEAEREAARRAAGITGTESAPGVLIWPVSGTITSPFGMRPNPFGGGPEFHSGLDIAAPTGTTVTAAASGTIISAGWYGGYGNYILIDHGGGMATGYGHLSQIFVSAGQHVQKGQAIGAVGSTGQSTGPHLHFEVRLNGKPTDPAAYLH
jgi:murein DD-endopeptidase MepM/ murein hydrolase activator NlpD